ncbi:MAG TPA: sigma-54 dependent transcriptional regulator [Polyangiaceae bacterium]|jgi:DNA-binding NtrC family response regulator|nr:sigma-54 dependent transcriptional regulator [Polyangiaceae bacterium]
MTERATVLVVDDDVELGKLVVDIVRSRGHAATSISAPTLALPLIEQQSFDLVITDVRMPGIDGVELIERVKAYDPRISIMAITAFGSLDTAIRAVRAGAYDYLPKPFEPEDLALRVDRALERRSMTLELSRLRTQVAKSFAVEGIIGKSQAMEDVTTLIRRVADSPATVLVTGPSGSGKELVARALHGESRRKNEKFVPVNCAAIPDTLLEAELFGVRKGAFTDARSDRAGMFQEANGGTLFLDEIGDLALPLQAKLLRALQEREVRPVGGNRSEAVDVRVVAATNRNLRAQVTAGTFREDLFYRLAVIEIGIPPLRDRPDDIPALAEHFLRRAAGRSGKHVGRFAGAAMKRMLNYDWPGNVRELENAVERAVALTEGDTILPDDLPDTTKVRRTKDFLEMAVDRQLTIEELNRAYAQIVLQRSGGQKKRAAALLGVDRRTLQRWFGEGATSPASQRTGEEAPPAEERER